MVGVLYIMRWSRICRSVSLFSNVFEVVLSFLRMKYAEFLLKNETMETGNGLDALTVAKISAMFTLGVTSFILGVLPIKLSTWLKWNISEHHHHHHHSNHSLPVNLLLSFGGGVLLYTTFMHLQPEVREGMQEVIAVGVLPSFLVNSGLHLSELIFCIGFFTVYLIEEVVHKLLAHTTNEEDMEALHRSMSMRKKCKQPENLIPRINLARQNPSPPSTITAASTKILINEKINRTFNHAGRNAGPPSESESSLSSNGNENSIKKSFRGFVAVLALSFHAIFEGLAVGLEREASDVWYLCSAIATHKLVIAFCIGVELISTRTKTLILVFYMATFALVSPIGIGIGLALTYDESVVHSPNISLASVILQGLASGTILYVVFFEVLHREKTDKQGMLQFLSIVAGFVVMVGLSLAIGHHHHHHHHEYGHEHNHQHEILNYEHTS